MRLKSFHVRTFRNVIDSGPIAVTQTTCLVGKNEAGKSTLLEALHHLNPEKPPAELDLLDQYPRWLKKQHEITEEIEDAVPITATFELNEDEAAKIASRFGDGVLQAPEVVATRKYGDEAFSLNVSLDHGAFVSKFVAGSVDAVLRDRVKDISTAEKLLTTLEEISQEVTSDPEPSPEAQAAKLAKTDLEEVLGESTSLTAAVNEVVRPLIPRTFYFTNYSQLRGRYALTEVLEAVEKGSADEQVQAAADFLTLAKITNQNIETWDFETANAELEAISSLLTRRVKENWKQNKHLKLIVTTEVVPAPKDDRFLQFRVEDTRHDFSSRLDRRSTGFRWFVSFIAAFFEFEKDENLILLLDEPGLSLHARAQKDLLDTIDTQLAVTRQVIYTTHSPFMVRIEALDRARVVEDQGPEVGAVVINDAGRITDPDTLFPLQAALGYDIAQNLFIGRRNILVEGSSDLLYLSVFSSHLDALGRHTMPENCRVLPSGGATNIATFIALLGKELDVVVLLDGKSESQRIDNAIDMGLLDTSRVVRIDRHVKVKGADIEDLFKPSEYLKLYNATFNRSLKLVNLTGKDRIVKRLERAEGKFDHGRVAETFLKDQTKVFAALSEDTLARFEAVIEALTLALPDEEPAE